MEEITNVLRQADADVMVEGLLSEKKLEKVTADGKEVIKGSLVIKTSDVNFTTLNVYVGRLTSKGEPNKAFDGMETVITEYVSIAEGGAEAATKVRCKRGNLQPNTYINRDGNETVGVRYSASYVSRVPENEELDCHSRFEVEGYIKTIAPEVIRDDETGRLKVTILVPLYNQGIEPLEIIVPETLTAGFESMLEVGQTAKFYGDLLNNVIIEEKTVSIGLGTAPQKKSYQYINERIITGASEPYEEEKAFSAEAIQKAMVERGLRIEKMKADAATARQNANKGKVAANQSASGRTIPKFNL